LTPKSAVDQERLAADLRARTNDVGHRFSDAENTMEVGPSDFAGDGAVRSFSVTGRRGRNSIDIGRESEILDGR
jgi:hypothetical protein